MPVAIPTYAFPRIFMVSVVMREETDIFTMLFPIKNCAEHFSRIGNYFLQDNGSLVSLFSQGMDPNAVGSRHGCLRRGKEGGQQHQNQYGDRLYRDT